jgi:antitoxin (DNA-binding transcriptional repressor) of toxin-antitoxin stability system
MKTITITEAKRSLGRYLKQAAAGEEIGIVSGADIISLRKVEVVPADGVAGVRVMEAAPDDWPVFEAVDGGPVDGALNHDKYIYDDPHEVRKGRKRQ